MEIKELEQKAAEVRIGIVNALHNSGSGHPGGSLSAADIVTALYFDEMNIDPANPKMEGRDKLILSKGHAGPVQYSALAVRGYYPMEDFMTLRKMGSKFQGHPDMHKVPGIEMSTGSLGQGFA
ncbi:MAG: transketolase, partial [Eubacterium sp.]|nr:transketolase [Candidatus Colimonas fimequi]